MYYTKEFFKTFLNLKFIPANSVQQHAAVSFAEIDANTQLTRQKRQFGGFGGGFGYLAKLFSSHPKF